MAGVTQPKVSRVAPPELVAWAQNGRIRVPQFQRSYRWDSEDAERLFDSIFRGYPIGNLLMWRKPAPAAEISLGELRFKAPERSDALWVVDGQQRLTTLIGALTASQETVDRRFRIFYDLRDKRFLSAPHSKQPADHWLPIWVAGDNRRLLAWQRERNWLTDEDFDRCDAVATAIRTYEIPMYEIEGDDEQALREIFDRMNTFGKTLKRAEIFQALHSAPLDVQPSDLEALRARLRVLEFGDFTSQILMQSVMALRGGKVDRDFRQEFKDDEDLHSAFSATEKALRLVVEFLKTDNRIPHMRLLPYALFVPVLARFTHLFGRPQGRAAELLRRWIWRGSAVGAAPQGNTVALRRNASAIEDDPAASAGRLLGLLPPGGEQWQPDLAQTALNRAQAKINVLGLLSAHPVLLADVRDAEGNLHPAGTRIERTRLLAELLDTGVSPLFPVMASSDRSIGNRLVHPSLSMPAAGLLLMNATPEVRRSHCVDDTCMELLVPGHLDDFVQRRSELVRKVIADYVQSMALWGFSDGPEPESLFSDDLWGDSGAA